MGIFDFLRKGPQGTASTAKNRLIILVQEERDRSGRGMPDYLPLLRRELLEVIRKFVNVDADAVDVKTHKDGDHDVLELSIALPDKPVAAAGRA
ncbi:MAG: cell division topological specificity factor MinE [Proteobacteria bacterium]|nr:cell division topological specificity factor MinE [Pseudomonadota bacterium]